MKIALRLAWISICLAFALTARCWNLHDVFIEGGVFFVDGDCYSRMTRVALVAEHPGTILRHHDFENWPEGTTPHTTALFDYLILGVKKTFDLGFAVVDPQRRSVLHAQTLDLAGALISPLLGLAGTLLLGVWWWRFGVRYGGMAMLMYAISPILVHGTVLGRPDHQSLEIFLLTVAGVAELVLAAPDFLELPDRRKKIWGTIAGAAWALSLWVSLYEPLILLVVVLALWLIASRRALWSPHRRLGIMVGLVIVIGTLVLEGWRVALPEGASREYFANWAKTIGELGRLDLRTPLLYGWLGWMVVAAPVLLVLARKVDRRALPLLVMLLVTLGLTVWQLRWGYFLAIVFVLALPWQLQALPRAWQAWALFIVGLWPVLKDWDDRLYPDDVEAEHVEMVRADAAALRTYVTATAGERAGPVLAPWWISPAIAYWTHNACVGGSSHQSLPGNVDIARFYLSTTPAEAGTILRRRQVQWVIVDDPERVIAQSAALLGVTPPDKPLAKTLMETPEEAPGFLRELTVSVADRPGGLRFYRLYVVDSAKLPP